MEETLQLVPNRDGRVWVLAHGRKKWWMHRHAELELNLVMGGSARYLLENRRYDLSPNYMVWLFPEQNHLLLDRSPDHWMWNLVFRPELLRRVCGDETMAALLDPNPPGYFCRRIPDDRAAWLAALFREIYDAEGDCGRFNAGLVFALLSSWSIYQTAGTATLGVDVHPAVEKAAHLLRQESEPLSVEAIAQVVGLSVSHLSHLFRDQTGMTLPQFRNRQRLDRFLRLYGQGRRISMLEAAHLAGFGSYPQFHRVFKQLMGVAPAGYRRQQQPRATS